MCDKNLYPKRTTNCCVNKKGGSNMAVMAKPLNISLRVREDKTDEFLNIHRDTSAMLKRFKRLRKVELTLGKPASDPEIVFLDKKIQEFENELKR